MLKLKPACSNQNLVICVGNRPPFFNRSLCQALGIALAIHIGAFLLFHIQTFYHESSVILTPIHVQAHLPSSNESVALLAKQEHIDKSILPPPPLLLPNTRLTDLTPSPSFSFPSLKDPVFARLEQIPLPSLPSPFPLVYHPIYLFIAGEIAEYPLIKADFDLLTTPVLVDHVTHYTEVRYEVRLDERSGCIMWYDKKQTSADAQLDRLAETILLSLQFTPDPHIPFPSGEVTFILATH